MMRLPLALGLALVIAAAAVVYVTVTPKSTMDVVVIDLNKVTVSSNITLPGLPKAIVFANFSAPVITSVGTTIYIDIPGGAVVDQDGYLYQDFFYVGRYRGNYGFKTLTVYFNTTEVSNWYDQGYKVIKPPKYVVIRFAPLS